MSRDKTILIGMMGAGKTTVGRLLARKAGRAFFDVDECVEAESGVSVADIFRRFGEAEFRRRELDALRSLAARPGAAVIAAGGGAFCQDEARAFMLERCHTVFLRVPEDELLRRLEGAGVAERPLLARPDWKVRVLELVRARYPVYQLADHVLEVGNEEPEITAGRLAAILGGMVREKGDAVENRG